MGGGIVDAGSAVVPSSTLVWGWWHGGDNADGWGDTGDILAGAVGHGTRRRGCQTTLGWENVSSSSGDALVDAGDGGGGGRGDCR